MKVYTVRDCARILSRSLEKEYLLRRISVRGTVSSLRVHFSGNAYFSLTDGDIRLECTIDRMKSAFLLRRLKNGDTAVVGGTVRYDSRRGRAVLPVEQVYESGESTEKTELEKLKRRLENAGWFDPAGKKPLPRFPFLIGLVTSSSGAAAEDVISTGIRRNPAVKYCLFSSSVQGRSAVSGLVRALEEAGSACPRPDILILTRGGGAEEELAVFNDPAVLKAVHDAEVPVISAVGHERDVTLADLTADRRAATPTQAAEMAVPELGDWQEQVASCRDRLLRGAESALTDGRGRLYTALWRMQASGASGKTEQERMQLRMAVMRLQRNMETHLKNRYAQLLEKMTALEKQRK